MELEKQRPFVEPPSPQARPAQKPPGAQSLPAWGSAVGPQDTCSKDGSLLAELAIAVPRLSKFRRDPRLL